MYELICMLKIQVKNPRQSTQQNAIWVVERLYSIGSDPADDLVLTDDSVSPKHASLITLDNRLYLRDNDSPQGCYVNNERVQRKEVVPGDVVRVGAVEILVMDPRDSLSQNALTDDELDNFWSLIANGSFLCGQEFYIQKNPCLVGRGTQCDIVLPSTHISRQHAEIKVQGSLLYIRDLASANGTFVNDNRISQGFAKPGDDIRFDRYSFRIAGPEKDRNLTMVRGPNIPTNIKTPTYSASDKQWQTKPTSPGNRIVEEDFGPSTPRKVFSGIVLAVMISVFVYLVVGIIKG